MVGTSPPSACQSTSHRFAPSWEYWNRHSWSGHVGSCTEQKNHLLWIEVAGEIARRDPNARFLLIGDGKLRPTIEKRAEQLNLSDKVVFARTRTDVPRLMLGATDCFFFPWGWDSL